MVRERTNRSGKTRFRRTPLIIGVATITFVAGGGLFVATRKHGLVVVMNSPTPDMASMNLSLQQSDLRPFFTDPDIGPLARIVAQRLAEYERLVENLQRLGSGKKIDIILQTHSSGVGEVDEKYEAERVRSQTRTLQLLNSLQPKVLGLEGSPIDRITEQTLRQYTLKQAASMGLPTTAEAAKAYVQGLASENRALNYVFSHPTVFAVGTEDDELNRFHRAVLLRGRAAESVASEAYKRSYKIHPKIRNTRSLIALVRLLNAMEVQKVRRGALVIGLDHHEPLETLMRAAGIRGRIYDTTK